jgi:selenocysteine lyase/cysteine desulfurase
MSHPRDLFSLPEGLHYLNCAYMSPLPRRVEEAGVAGLIRKRVPSAIAPADFFADGNRIRALFGALVNAPADRIAIVPSASYGLAVAARNLTVASGQNIVVAAEQFPSNVYLWRRLAAEAGAQVRTVPRPRSARRGEAWNAAILDAIDSGTAVVATGHVHWTDGTLFDVSAIGAAARAVGAAFVLDATQSAGALPLDVQALQADAVVVAAYKWLLGPYGIGVAYYGERFSEGVPLEEPWIIRPGSEDFRRLVEYRDAYREGAARFDAGGMSNFITVPMLRASLELINELGVTAIERHCRALTGVLLKEARQSGWGVDESENRAAHIVGLTVPERIDATHLERMLGEARVVVSLRGPALRVSPHVYNDRVDVDALVEVLGGVLSERRRR